MTHLPVRSTCPRYLRGSSAAEIRQVCWSLMVRNHITSIFDKLGVHSRARAIVLAKDGRLPAKIQGLYRDPGW